MDIQMNPLHKRMLDDVFDAFSMISGGNYVSLMHVGSGVARYSPGYVELFGMPGEYIENGAEKWVDYIHPEDRKRYQDTMKHLKSGDAKAYDLTYRVRSKSGEYVVCRCTGAVLHDSEGKPSLIGGLTVNQGLMENTDPITVLPNKYSYFEDLKALMQENRESVSLLIGISKLSQLNRIYGFTYGNRVLQAVAWLIQETVGERGKVYRADDATFIFLTDRLSPEETGAIYDSIRFKLQRGISVDGVRNILTGNGGMLSVRWQNMDAATAYSCLNYAYKESKLHRHGELVDFNGTIRYDLRETLEMVNTIRDCILDNCKGFSLNYQPVIDSETEKLTGAEALIRWEGEPYGEVQPLKFIPILEKDYIFEELGNWIIRQVTEDGKKFLEKDPNFVMGLNISAAQLEDEYFIDSMVQILRESGFPPRNLCLEVTKDCRQLEIGRLKEIVDLLHAHHIRVIIDDFGAGFESIGFLKRLPADYIKFDRELIREIENSDADKQTMEYLAHLAAIRGTHVIVKGVETAEMRDIIRDFSIESMQGNYYSKPITMEQMMAEFYPEDKA